MNPHREAQDRRMLARWENVWMDPDWDPVLGYDGQKYTGAEDTGEEPAEEDIGWQNTVR